MYHYLTRTCFAVPVATLILFAACGDQPEETTYVARIGEIVFTEADLEKSLPPMAPGRSRASHVENAINQWAQRELLYLEAVHSGLTRDLDLEMRVDNYRKSLYGSAFLDMHLSGRVTVSTDEVRRHYRENRETFRRNLPEVHALHFLLATEDEAADVKGGLLSYDGEVRQNLLASYAVDISAVTPGQLVPELDDLLFGARPARGVIGPVRSDHGYHVLEVLDRYPAGSYKGLDEGYDEISQDLFRFKSEMFYLDLMDSLKAVHSLQINRDYLGND